MKLITENKLSTCEISRKQPKDQESEENHMSILEKTRLITISENYSEVQIPKITGLESYES